MTSRTAKRKADGSVFERNGKWGWRADAVAGSTVGRRRQMSRQGYSSQEEAEAALGKFLATRPTYRGEYQEPDKITVRDFLERWISSKECAGAAHPIEPTTAEGYRKAAVNISHYVGDKLLDELTSGHLKEAWDRLGRDGGPRGRTLGKKSIANASTMMRTALRDAVAEGLVTRNVATDATPPKVALAPVKESKFWFQDQLRVLLTSTADNPHYLSWLLAGTTGMRRGEVLGATWDKLDLDTGELFVVKTRTTVKGKSITKGVKTPASNRTICIDGETLKILRAWKLRQNELRAATPEWEGEDFIITMADGTLPHPNDVSKAFVELTPDHGHLV